MEDHMTPGTLQFRDHPERHGGLSGWPEIAFRKIRQRQVKRRPREDCYGRNDSQARNKTGKEL